MAEESKFDGLTQKQQAAIDFAINKEHLSGLLKSNRENDVLIDFVVIDGKDEWRDGLREVYANVSPEALDNLVDKHQAYIQEQVEKASFSPSVLPFDGGDNASLPQKTGNTVQR